VTVDVQAEDGVHVLKHPGLNQRFGPARWPFLGRLEDEPRVGPKVATVTTEEGGGAQQHGHVSVVAAEVRQPGFGRAVGAAAKLLDRQGVHVRTQGDGADPSSSTSAPEGPPRGASSPEVGDYVGLGQWCSGSEAELAQLGAHVARGFPFLESQFRVAVKVSPPGGELFL
jgi:hypothetical protein